MLKPNPNGFFPYTPATNCSDGLREAVAMLMEEGMANVFARHDRHAEAARRAVRAWGLEILCADPAEYSSALTAVLVPEGHDADDLRRVVLDRFDMSLGAGLGKLAGKVFRIGHLGDFNDLSLAGTLAGVEMGPGSPAFRTAPAACRWPWTTCRAMRGGPHEPQPNDTRAPLKMAASRLAGESILDQRPSRASVPRIRPLCERPMGQHGLADLVAHGAAAGRTPAQQMPSSTHCVSRPTFRWRGTMPITCRQAGSRHSLRSRRDAVVRSSSIIRVGTSKSDRSLPAWASRDSVAVLDLEKVLIRECGTTGRSRGRIPSRPDMARPGRDRADRAD